MPSLTALPLVQGTLDLLVLRTLAAGPMHGYGIASLVDERTRGELVIEDAALYQALHRLDRQGLVDAEWRASDNNRRPLLHAHAGGATAPAGRHRQLAPAHPSGRRGAGGHVMRPFWHWRRRRHELAAELDDELTLHLELRAEELARAGLSPDAARREAVRSSETSSTRRYCRRQDHMKATNTQRGLALDELAQDLPFRCEACGACRPRHSRSLHRRPGDRRHDRDLRRDRCGHPQPTALQGTDRLVRIYTDAPPNKFRFSVADYLALEAQQTHFDQVAAYTDRPLTFTDGTVAERVWARDVTPSYFALLGIGPVLGRGFAARDGEAGRPPAVVLSHAFWQRRLGARRDVIGSTVRLDGRDHLLVGVLPPQAGPLGQESDVFVATQFTTPPRRARFAHGPRTSPADRGS